MVELFEKNAIQKACFEAPLDKLKTVSIIRSKGKKNCIDNITDLHHLSWWLGVPVVNS